MKCIFCNQPTPYKIDDVFICTTCFEKFKKLMLELTDKAFALASTRRR